MAHRPLSVTTKGDTTMQTVSPKVRNGSLGAAVATVVVFVAVKLGLDLTAEESVALTGALATIVSAGAGYFTWDE